MTPKTAASGGKGGIFGQVPGGFQAGSTDRPQSQAPGGPGQSQGHPLGLDDQGQAQGQAFHVDRQGQAQFCAHGGLGQAQGGHALGSARQASGLLGMIGLGGIPSHVSLLPQQQPPQ